MSQLILASSSPHRAGLLQRLGIPFIQVSPDVDESPLENELPHDLAGRLAREKAQAVATKHPTACLIGSDQLAVFDNRILGKPGSRDNAVAQLSEFSNQVVQFLTSVAVIANGQLLGHSVVEPRVAFRRLEQEEIVRYVETENPIDCAGSFKAEALGVTLFESLFSQDPTAIIGLPLIETCRLLRQAGYQLP